MDENMLRQWAMGLEIIPGAKPLKDAVLKLLDEKKAQESLREGSVMAAGFNAIIRMENRVEKLEKERDAAKVEVEQLRKEFGQLKIFAAQVNQNVASLDGKAARETTAVKSQLDQVKIDLRLLDEGVSARMEAQTRVAGQMRSRINALEAAAKKPAPPIKKKPGAKR